jgi:hypothetical protein
LPPNDEDLIPLYIGSDVSKPFWIKWGVVRQILTPIIPSGTAAWGSIATGGGVASQTDLIAYLVANFYPLLTNPAGYVTSAQLSTTLIGYVTTAALTAALANYVPTSRTLTINGVTFDLSADRSWTVSGGSAAWGSIGTGTGVASQADLVAYLVANYYPLSSNPAGYITISALANYVQNSRAVNTSGSLTGGGNLSADRTLQLVNDSASPGNTRYYGTDGSGNKGFFTFPSAPTPVAAKFYQQDNWTDVGLGNISVEYVPSLNKVYITNFTSGNITILNATTGDFIASAVAAFCIKCKYIASVNQVYVTSSSSASIIRIDGATNLALAPISIGVTANGADILEYSASKVFITCSNVSGSIMVVDPAAGTVTTTITLSVPTVPFGMALNTNPSSLQFNKIVVSAGGGIFIVDPTTNTVSTTLANPSSAISNGRFIIYSPVDDIYYVPSFSNSRLVILSIATATTFTATSLRNQQNISSVLIDEANDYLFMFPLASTGSGPINLAAKMFKRTTLEPIVTIAPTNLTGAGGSAGFVSMDLPNNRIFLVGRNASFGSVSILRYL